DTSPHYTETRSKDSSLKKTVHTPESTNILKRSRPAFCEAIKGKFGCAAVINNVDFTTGSSFGRNKGAIVPDVMYSKQFSNGVTISVWKDDLTTHKADAVVNAANEHLSHGGGLALALSRAGGPQIQQQSDQIIKVQGRVPTGEAVVTPAGNLPCKYIIHAVGPCVPPNPSRREIDMASPYLEKAIESIFKCAEYDNLQSVAIPAISSGLYNFPLHLCADIIVHRVRSFSKMRRPQSGPLEVRLVNNDDPSVREMLRACNQFLGPSDSQTGATQIQSTSSSKPTGSCLELGNVTLYLRKGSIEQETADVIVNTISNDLDLTKGYVSKAILDKAGNRIQAEIKRTGPQPAPNGHVMETSGGNLNCRAVYHTVVTSSSQTVHKVVSVCLERADKRGFSSISFPAIGTGHLGFGKEEVSRIMIRAVAEFAQKMKVKKMDVHFVIFHKDLDTYKAFEMQMASFKKQQSPHWQSSALHESNEASRTPFIELHADSPEALREAKSWAVGILHITSSNFTITNNHITQFGQEDHVKLSSLQSKFNVHITEFFMNGKCGVTIFGDNTDVSSAALEVEAMLCQVQENLAQAEENDLLHSVVCWQAFPGSEQPEVNAALEKAYLAGTDKQTFSVNGQHFKIDFKNMQMESGNGGARIERICIFNTYSKLAKRKSGSYARTPVDKKSSVSRETKKTLDKYGLCVTKMERIENHALAQVFELNEKRIPSGTEKLYQCVTAQFCELICRVGFQRDYAPPKEQKYGAGIYFTTEVEDALKLWNDSEEQYIYIIVAQVLTGNSTLGSPQMIVPPPIKNDPLGVTTRPAYADLPQAAYSAMPALRLARQSMALM
ncbi:hypothetical protein NFI96_025982, partial [Prochilodus magdalenae]